MGDRGSWKGFVEAYSGFLYSLAWRYARGDIDVASELVLFALEGLRKPDAEDRPFYRLRSYLDSLSRFGKRSRFVTWLALVSKNLFRDWFREHEGRRLLPKEIEDLDSRDQEIFKLLFWEGMSEHEVFARLGTGQKLSPAEFDERVERINFKLRDKNLLVIYRDLLRRVPVVSLGDRPTPDGIRRFEVADPNPEFRPDVALEKAEEREAASVVGALLKDAIHDLPETTRNVLLLHIVQGLSGEEVRRIMGFRTRQRVYDELAKARRRIGNALVRSGVDREMAFQVEGLLDGYLEDSVRFVPDSTAAAVVKKRKP